MPRSSKRRKKKAKGRKQTTDHAETIDLSKVASNPKDLLDQLELLLEIDPYLINVQVLTTLAESVVTVPKLRDAGVTTFFLRLILEPEHLSELSTGGYPPWIYPLNGIVNLCIAMDREPIHEVDLKIKLELVQAFEAMLKIIWVDSKRFLIFSSKTSRETRREVARYITCLLTVEMMYTPLVHSCQGLGLAATCWILPTDHRPEVCEMIELLFEYVPKRNRGELIRRAITEVGGAQETAKHAERLLSEYNLVNAALVSELKTLLHFTSSLPEEFLGANIAKPVIDAALRQSLRYSTSGNVVETCNVMLWAGAILKSLVANSKNESLAIMRVINAGYFKIVGQMLLLFPSFKGVMASFKPVLDNIHHIAGCNAEEGCCTHPMAETPKFLLVTRTHMSRVYLFFKDRLENNESTSPQDLAMATAHWVNLGSSLHVIEDEIRAQWRQSRRCSYAVCPNYDPFHEGDHVSSTMRCAACGMTYYDRTECQKADWNRHKSECKMHRAAKGL